MQTTCGQCLGRKCEDLCRRTASGLGGSCSQSRRNFQAGGKYMGEVAETAALVWFSSQEGRDLFSRSMRKCQAESYFPLTEQFLTQSAPPNCGPATLAMVLNSLRIDPGRVWKSPWRWFTEETLTSCVSVAAAGGGGETSEEVGTTMHKFALMAECNGATAQTFFAKKSNVKFFRSTVQKVTASHHQRLVVCFDRGALGQTGTGHYSPVAAYDEETDMVLILDVARFKYPPYWVPVEDLFKAMEPVDVCTGNSRGFFVVSHSPGDLGVGSHSASSESTTASLVSLNRPGVHEELTELIEELLTDKHNDRLREAAARFVHEARGRLLNKDDVIHEKLKLISTSSFLEKLAPILTRILQKSCDSPCGINRGCTRNFLSKPGACAAPLLAVGLSRPIDFFVRSLPQELCELVILFLTEKGAEFLEPADHARLLAALPRNSCIPR